MTVQGSPLRLVVFGIEGQRYALRLGAVERVLPMATVSPLPKAPTVALGVINLHGQVVPVLNIRSLPPVAAARLRDLSAPGELDSTMAGSDALQEPLSQEDA